MAQFTIFLAYVLSAMGLAILVVWPEDGPGALVREKLLRKVLPKAAHGVLDCYICFSFWTGLVLSVPWWSPGLIFHFTLNQYKRSDPLKTETTINNLDIQIEGDDVVFPIYKYCSMDKDRPWLTLTITNKSTKQKHISLRAGIPTLAAESKPRNVQLPSQVTKKYNINLPGEHWCYVRPWGYLKAFLRIDEEGHAPLRVDFSSNIHGHWACPLDLKKKFSRYLLRMSSPIITKYTR